ncbi:MAG: hypothetical protein KGI80_04845 [Verrucomicrobiota bacterium]|nr:hypothetical protein [Verrucomicrobiota bacterium]
MARRFLILLLLVLSLLLVGKGWHLAKDGFAIGRISSFFPLPASCQEANHSLPEGVSWDEPFSYLGRGRQNYAFVSKDQRFVIKLPRWDLHQVPFWMRALPFLEDYRALYRKEKERRHRSLMKSFELAEHFLQQETALLFFHPAATRQLQKRVVLVDRLGRQFFIDLDCTAFLLQKRCDLLIPAFLSAVSRKDQTEKENLLTAFLRYNAVRTRKKIHNKDPTFQDNFAFEGKDVLQIDVGSLYLDDSIGLRSSFLKLVDPFCAFLKEVDPEMVSWFRAKAEEMACEFST